MKRLALLALLVVAIVPLQLSCGEKETPEQHLARLRARYEIIPAGIAAITESDGSPALLVDAQIVGKGAEPLDTLTVLVRVLGANGSEKMAKRITFDLSGMRPGVGERRSATIPGVTLAEDDQVFIEIEGNLSDEELHQLPEWSQMTGRGR
jgi:hypothetical protein